MHQAHTFHTGYQGRDKAHDISVRAIRDGALWTLKFVVALYLALCIYNGFIWSIELAPTYGLTIIRGVVIIALSVCSAFTLPFEQGHLVLPTAIAAAILVAPVSFVGFFLQYTVLTRRWNVRPDELGGLSSSSGFQAASVLLFGVVLTALSIDLYACIEGHSAGTVGDFLVMSSTMRLVYIGALASWLLACLVAPVGLPDAGLRRDIDQAALERLAGSAAEELLQAQQGRAWEARLVQAMEHRHGVSDIKCKLSGCEGLALHGKSFCAHHHPKDPDIVLSMGAE
jgi:hypothetical protein